MAKIVNIEWMQPIREVHCPCCSAQALDAEGKVANKPCRHFLFSWDGDRQDFDDFNDEVESVLDDVSLNVEGPTDQTLVSALPEPAVDFQLTTRDEALGPIVRTDVVAFNPVAT